MLDMTSPNLSSTFICQYVVSRWRSYICRNATYMYSYFTNRFDISWNVDWFHLVLLVIFDKPYDIVVIL